MEGFTVKCNKCGKEVVITTGNFELDGVRISSYLSSESVFIMCDCENLAEEY